MKNWILTHKRLYFVIVGIIAFLAFTIITFIGLGKVHDAEAATDVTYNSHGEIKTATVYDLRELSWEYWLNNTQPAILAWYDNPENLANDIIAECNYWVVTGGNIYYFFVEPFYHDSSLSGQCNIFLNYDNGYVLQITTIDGVPSVTSVSGMYDNHHNNDSSFDVMYNYGSNIVGSSYDFLVNCTDSRKDEITRNNLNYPRVIGHSSDAPYFNFKRVSGQFGKSALNTRNPVLLDFYSAISDCEWVYFGHLNNMSDDAQSYMTELEFVVEMPTFECLDNMFGLKEGIAYYEYDSTRVLSELEDALLRWNQHRNLDKQVYKFTYPLVIEPNEDGDFHFTLTYADILNYLRYCNDDMRTLFNQYSKGHQGLITYFARIHSMTGSVVTTYPSQILTGRTTYNEWGSLSYDSCLEVILEQDKDSADYDSAFEDAYDEKYDEYVNGLKSEIEDLQNQLDNYHATNDAFGNLNTTSIWSGFAGIVSGLLSYASSVTSLSVLTGSVFGFMPSPVTSIMQFTFVAICIIAIIKAIRG